MARYYIWNGIGAVEDLDGHDLPLATNRGQAWEIFRVLGKERGEEDITLWERDWEQAGGKATLLAIVTDRMSDGTRCFQSIDPDKSSKPLSGKG